MDIASFEDSVRTLTAEHGVSVCLRLRKIVGVGNLTQRQSLQVVTGITENLAKPLVCFDELAIQVRDDDAHGGLVEGRSQAQLAGVQSLLGPAPVTHIMEDH